MAVKSLNDLYGRDYGLIQAREVPQVYKTKILEWLDLKPQDEVLEIGCAAGSLLKFIRKYSPKAVGMDVNEELLREVKTQETFVGDITNPPFPADKFNKSLSSHTLEHVKDLKIAFQKLDLISKSGSLSFHAFPAEKLRGVGAFGEAWALTTNPIKAFFLARKLHINKLNPRKIRKLIQGTNWKLIKAEKVYVKDEGGPAWMILLAK